MTSNTSELLELAAKAAGIGPLDFNYARREGCPGMYFGPRLPLPTGVLMAANYTYWNPIDDDGDALRLAVKLNISIIQNEFLVRAHNKSYAGINVDFFERTKEEATRMAIVLVAAEIGRAMP